MANVEVIGIAVETGGLEKGIRTLNSLAELGPKVERSMEGIGAAAKDADKAVSNVGSGGGKGLKDVGDGAKGAADGLKKVSDAAAVAEQSVKKVAVSGVSGIERLNAASSNAAKSVTSVTSAYNSAAAGVQSFARATTTVSERLIQESAALSGVNSAIKASGDANASAARQALLFASAIEKLTASSATLEKSSNSASAALEKIAKSSERSSDGLKGSASAAGATSESFLSLAKAGVAAFAGSQILQWGISTTKSLYQASAAAENLRTSLQFSTGNSAGEIEYLRKVTDQLGLQFDKTASSYGRFSAASMGTALEGQKTRDVFESIAKASAVMGLSTDQSEGALRALEQMISKGTVSSEELRGQLGERLPGAFQIAARSMGVTTQELGKMLEKGEVITADFLPKFAAELQRSLGDSAESAANRLDAAVNRFANSWDRLKQRAGDSGISKAMAGELEAVSRDVSAVGETIENAAKRGDGAFMALSKGAGVAAGRVAFSTLNLAANTLNGTFNYLSGGLLDFNTKLAILPEGFKTNAEQIAAMSQRLNDADKLLKDLQMRSDKSGGGAYYTAEISRVRALRNEYREALSDKVQLTGITQTGGGRGSINPQTIEEINREKKANADAIKSYLERDSRMTKLQQKERDVARAREENAKLVARAEGDANALTKIRIALQTELSSIEDKYKDKTPKGAGAGQSELASLQARVKETQRYIESLKSVGLQAEKTNEGERIAAKLQEELAMSLSKTARASKEKLLAEANNYAAALKTKDALELQLKAQKAFEDARQKEASKADEGIQKIEDRIQATRDEIDAYGLGAEALTALSIARLQERKAILTQFEGSEELIDRLNREIDAMQRLSIEQDTLSGKKLVTSSETVLKNARELNLAYEDENKLVGLSSVQREKIIAQRQVELKYAKLIADVEKSGSSEDSKREALSNLYLAKQEEMSAAANKVMQDDFAKTSQQIEQSLTDALMRGFESGKGFAENFRNTLRNMINTLVLKPIISAAVQPVAGAITNSVTSALGVGGSGGSNALGMASNASSLSNLSSLAGLGSIGGALSGFGTAMTASIQSLLGITGTTAQMVTSLTAAGHVAAPGMAAGVGAFNAIPGWGWALGAGALLLSQMDFSSRGANHSGAAYSSSGIGNNAAAEQIFGSTQGDWYGDVTQRYNAEVDSKLAGTVGALAGVYNSLTGYAGEASRKIDLLGAFVANGVHDDEDAYGYGQIRDKLTGEVLGAFTNRELGTDTDAAWTAYVGQMGGLIVDQLKASDIPGWMKQQLNAIEGEVTIDGLNAALKQIAAIDAGFKSLTQSMAIFDGISSEMETVLLNLSGGIEGLATNAGAYYQGFYTEAERMEILSGNLRAALDSMDLSINPAMGQEAKDSYRQAVESAFETGNATVAAQLLTLSSNFATAADYAQKSADEISQAAIKSAQDAAKAQEDALKAQEDTAQAAIQAALTLTQSLQSGLISLEARFAGGGLSRQYQSEGIAGDLTALFAGVGISKNSEELSRIILGATPTEIERDFRILWEALDTDEARLKLTQVAGAMLDVANAADEQRKSLQNQFMQLTGDTEGLRAQELAALDPTNRAMQELIWSIEDGKTAFDSLGRAVEDAASRANKAWGELGTANNLAFKYLNDPSGLQAQQTILQAQIGSSTDPSARLSKLQELIGIEEALQSLTVNNREIEKAALTARQSALQNELQSAQQLLSAAQSLGAYARTLQTSASSGLSDTDRLSALGGEYGSLVGKARRGDVNAMQGLQSVAGDYLGLSQTTATSGAEYSVFAGRLASELENVAGRGEGAANSQINLLQSQLDQIALQSDLLSADVELSEATRALIAKSALDQREVWDKEDANAIQLADMQKESVSALSKMPSDIGKTLSPIFSANSQFLASSIGGSVYNAITAIAGMLGAGNNLPAFDVGTNYVPRNMKAIIHEGEAIIPKSFNPWAGGGGGLGGGSNAEVVAALSVVVNRLDAMDSNLNQIAVATTEHKDMFDNVTAGGNGMAVEIMTENEVTA